MEKVFNARQARKLTEKTLGDSSVETKETLEMIRFFAQSGEFSCDLEKCLSFQTVKTLQKMGYKVRLVAFGFSKTAHRISW